MLKKTIKYTDLNGEEASEDYFFNLSKAELIELEASHKEGLSVAMQRIIDAEDGGAIIMEFKKIILMSYGQKSMDGRRFIKNQTMRDEFESSEAYSTLFVELVTDADAASEFINGIVPQGLAEDAEKIAAKQASQASKNEQAVMLNPEPETMSLADFVKLDSVELPKAQARIARGELRILRDEFA